jgi:hypothetical protein
MALLGAALVARRWSTGAVRGDGPVLTIEGERAGAR